MHFQSFTTAIDLLASKYIPLHLTTYKQNLAGYWGIFDECLTVFKFTLQLNEPFISIGTEVVVNCFKYVMHYKPLSLICRTPNFVLGVGIYYLYSITFHMIELDFWSYVPFNADFFALKIAWRFACWPWC